MMCINLNKITKYISVRVDRIENSGSSYIETNNKTL